MPRIANRTDALLSDLGKRLASLVQTARSEGREEALADLRNLVGSGPAKRGRPAGKTVKKRRKSGKPRKNPWAKYTAAEKLARINKMRKGRGLPLKKKL